MVKVLTDPDVVKEVVCFFTSPESVEYQEKVQMMKPFLKTKDVNIEDLPDKLKYHLVLMECLSSCTISNANMATIEAKAQALFSFYDIVRAMLDPRTLLLVKIKMGMFFFNSTVDCEMVVPGMENSACMWELIRSFATVFVLARDELRTIEKCGWEASNVSRQNIEYMLVCVRITCAFFGQYYNPLTFRIDEIAANASDALKLNMNKINDV